jgi:hypothetical protein
MNRHHAARSRTGEETHEQSSGFDYGWVALAADALMTCVGFGATLSLVVFLQPISGSMGWSSPAHIRSGSRFDAKPLA